MRTRELSPHISRPLETISNNCLWRNPRKGTKAYFEQFRSVVQVHYAPRLLSRLYFLSYCVRGRGFQTEQPVKSCLFHAEDLNQIWEYLHRSEIFHIFAWLCGDAIHQRVQKSGFLTLWKLQLRPFDAHTSSRPFNSSPIVSVFILSRFWALTSRAESEGSWLYYLPKH